MVLRKEQITSLEPSGYLGFSSARSPTPLLCRKNLCSMASEDRPNYKIAIAVVDHKVCVAKIIDCAELHFAI